MQADLLGQIAGRSFFRSKSILLRLLALPYNFPIHLARWRWTQGWWGPVPEGHLYTAMRTVGLFLYRWLHSRFPTRSVDG